MATVNRYGYTLLQGGPYQFEGGYNGEKWRTFRQLAPDMVVLPGNYVPREHKGLLFTFVGRTPAKPSILRSSSVQY